MNKFFRYSKAAGLTILAIPSFILFVIGGVFKMPFGYLYDSK